MRSSKVPLYREVATSTSRPDPAISRTYAYKTTTVIAGIPPLDYLVEERGRIYEAEEQDRKNIKEETIIRWQQRWETTQEGARWKRKLISDVKKWILRKHGEIDYYVTQILTGHGCEVGAYLKRVGKAENENYWYCTEVDRAEHTMFYCNRWERGEPITPENLTSGMIEHERVVAKERRNILKEKGEEEKRRQAR